MIYYFYRIYSLDNAYIYIGSTRNFNKRVNDHKSTCNNKNSKSYNIKLYSTIRNNKGLDNFLFEIIDSIDADDRQLILKHEQELMIKYNSNLNTYRAFLSVEDKKQEKIQYNNQYRIDNNEILNNKKKEKFTCACNGRYTRYHKAEHLKSKKHKKFEEQQIINNTTNNITINFNITIQK